MASLISISSCQVKVLCYTVESLEHYLPSLACLAPESYLHLTAVASSPNAANVIKQTFAPGSPVDTVLAVLEVRMLAEFNFAQFLQGENNPHAIWLLACSLEREGERVLKRLDSNGLGFESVTSVWHTWHG